MSSPRSVGALRWLDPSACSVQHVAPWFGSQQVTAAMWGGVTAQKEQAANVSAYWGDGEWQQVGAASQAATRRAGLQRGMLR